MEVSHERLLLKIFKNDGHTYLYRPGVRERQTLWLIFLFQKYQSFVNLIICCKFFSITDFVTDFQHEDKGDKISLKKGQGQSCLITMLHFVKF